MCVVGVCKEKLVRGILGSSAFIVSQYDFQRRTKVVRVSEWVSAGLLSVLLVGQDARVQVEEKLFPSSLRFTDPFLLLVLEPGEQAVGVLSFCHAASVGFPFLPVRGVLSLALCWSASGSQLQLLFPHETPKTLISSTTGQTPCLVFRTVYRAPWPSCI